MLVVVVVFVRIWFQNQKKGVLLFPPHDDEGSNNILLRPHVASQRHQDLSFFPLIEIERKKSSSAGLLKSRPYRHGL